MDQQHSVPGTAEEQELRARLEQAEQRARRAEARLAELECVTGGHTGILDGLQDAVTMVDMAGRVSLWNRGAEVLFEVPAADALGQRREGLFRWEWHTPGAEDAKAAALWNLGSWRGEACVTLRSGTRKDVETHVTLLRTADGRATGMVSVVRDMTAQRAVTAALEESERNFRTMAENSPDAITRVDLEGRYVYANPVVTRVLGRDANDFLGCRPRDLPLPTAATARLEVMAQHVLQTGRSCAQPVDFELPGGLFTFDVRMVPERDALGQVRSVLTISRDTTAERQTRRALEASQRDFQALLDNTLCGIVVWEARRDAAGTITDWEVVSANAAAAERGRLPGHRLLAVHDPIRGAALAAQMAALLAQGPGARANAEYSSQGKHYHYSAFHMGPDRMGIMMFDITGRVGAEEALRESQQLLLQNAAELDAVLQAIPVLVLRTRNGSEADVEGNRAAEEWVGVAPKSNIGPVVQRDGLGWRVRRHGVDLEPRQMPLAVAASSGQSVQDSELEVVDAHGRSRFLLGSAVPLPQEDGQPRDAVAVYVDVTAQRQTNEFTSRLLDLLVALSTALTPAEVAQVVVSEMVRSLEAAAGLLVAVEPGEPNVRFVHHQGYSPEVMQQWRNLPLDLNTPLTVSARTGQEFLFESNAEWLAQFPLLAQRARSNTGAMAVFPLDFRGRALGAIGLTFPGPRQFTAQDVSFLRAMASQSALALERARLFAAEQEARASAQEASEARERFLALVSHELRNPLAALTNAAQLMLRYVPPGDRVHHLAEIIERNGRQQARLVEDLLDVSRLHRTALDLQRRPLVLADVVDAAVSAHQLAATQARLSLDVRLDHTLRVDGDPDRLQQVVGNLLHNALKFTPAGGTIRVQLSRREGHAALEVEDTGAGLEPELLAHVFELFRQGPGGRRSGGLGIGLALVKGLTELHGGQVHAHSAGPERGSRFTVLLPLLPNRPADPAGEPAAWLLVVEDNADSRMVLAETLRLAGYAVLEAASGAQALEAAAARRPDLVLCDIGLPDLDGCEVLQRLRGLPATASVPAIAVTALDGAADRLRVQAAGFAVHMAKPVDMNTLTRRVRECLRR